MFPPRPPVERKSHLFVCDLFIVDLKEVAGIKKDGRNLYFYLCNSEVMTINVNPLSKLEEIYSQLCKIIT